MFLLSLFRSSLFLFAYICSTIKLDSLSPIYKNIIVINNNLPARTIQTGARLCWSHRAYTHPVTLSNRKSWLELFFIAFRCFVIRPSPPMYCQLFGRKIFVSTNCNNSMSFPQGGKLTQLEFLNVYKMKWISPKYAVIKNKTMFSETFCERKKICVEIYFKKMFHKHCFENMCWLKIYRVILLLWLGYAKNGKRKVRVFFYRIFKFVSYNWLFCLKI